MVFCELKNRVNKEMKKMVSKAIKTYVHYIICFVIIFGFGHIPPLGPLTPFGMQIAGIFLGAVYGWSFVDMMIPSIFGIIALIFVEGNTLTSVAAAGFGNQIVWFLIFLLVFINVIEEEGLTKFFAVKILTMRFIEGKPILLIGAFMVGAYLIGAINAFAAMFILWGILYTICDVAGYKPYEKFPTIMIIGITLFSVLGFVLFPFQVNSVGILMVFEQISGLTVDIVPYATLMLCMAVLCLLVFLLLVKFIYRPDLSAIMTLNVRDVIDVKKLNAKQKIILSALAILIVLLIVPSFFPKEWLITKVMNSIGLMGSTAIVMMVLMIIRVNGNPILDFNKMIARGIPWGAIFVTAFVLPLAPFITSEETGIQTLIKNIISPFEGLPPMVFLMIVYLIATIVTNFANNAATAMIVLPVILGYSDVVGLSPQALVTILIACAHLAIATPAACPMAGAMFGNSKWIKGSDVYKYAPLMVICCFIVMFISGTFLARIIF